MLRSEYSFLYLHSSFSAGVGVGSYTRVSAYSISGRLADCGKGFPDSGSSYSADALPLQEDRSDSPTSFLTRG